MLASAFLALSLLAPGQTCPGGQCRAPAVSYAYAPRPAVVYRPAPVARPAPYRAARPFAVPARRPRFAFRSRSCPSGGCR